MSKLKSDKSETRDQRITVVVSETTRKKLEALAKKEERGVSWLIAKWIEEHV